MYFRDKSKSGWPGDILLECNDNSLIHLPRNKRTAVKDYFTPERCLYCLDKFNQFADVSVGDNYTKKDELQYVSKSVIIRTERASKCFREAIDDDIFESFAANMNDIVHSQKIINRYSNLKNQYSKNSAFLIKNTEFGNVDTESKNKKYFRLLQLIRLGSIGDFGSIDEDVKKI